MLSKSVMQTSSMMWLSYSSLTAVFSRIHTSSNPRQDPQGGKSKSVLKDLQTQCEAVDLNTTAMPQPLLCKGHFYAGD